MWLGSSGLTASLRRLRGANAANAHLGVHRWLHDCELAHGLLPNRFCLIQDGAPLQAGDLMDQRDLTRSLIVGSSHDPAS